MGIRAGRGRPKAAGMEYAEIIEAIGREAADLLLAEAVDAEEWFDMIAELPAEYSGFIPERSA
jgi:hypothetical protein